MSIIENLANAIIDGDSELAKSLSYEIITKKINISKAIIEGLNKGMTRVSELYSQKEYYLPEIIISADSLYSALEILKPHMHSQEMNYKGTIVIGVIRGDIHDIGKNLTKTFLEANGYKVIDCGRNVKIETFIDVIIKENAEILAISTLMNPTLDNIKKLVEKLKEKGLRRSLKIIIGGAATSKEFAERIGVIYCNDASKASFILDNLIRDGV